MIRQIPKIALFIGALALAGQANADHRGWGGPAVVGALVGAAVVGAAVSSGRDRTVYVERQPVYYQPAPVTYYAPPPPPVYYQPAYEVVERYPAPPPPGYYRHYGPPPGPGYYYGPPRGRW